jgi:hypothetical protein
MSLGVSYNPLPKPHKAIFENYQLNGGGVDNIIPHNLGLSSPIHVSLEARESLPSGSEVSLRVTDYTSDTITIVVTEDITTTLIITG